MTIDDTVFNRQQGQTTRSFFVTSTRISLTIINAHKPAVTHNLPKKYSPGRGYQKKRNTCMAITGTINMVERTSGLKLGLKYCHCRYEKIIRSSCSKKNKRSVINTYQSPSCIVRNLCSHRYAITSHTTIASIESTLHNLNTTLRCSIVLFSPPTRYP